MSVSKLGESNWPSKLYVITEAEFENKFDITFNFNKDKNYIHVKLLRIKDDKLYTRELLLGEEFEVRKYVANSSAAQFYVFIKIPLEVGDYIFLTRHVTIDQPAQSITQYATSDLLISLFDKLTLISQDMEFDNLYNVKVPKEVDIKRFNTELPELTSLINKAIGVNEDCTGFIGLDINGGGIQQDIDVIDHSDYIKGWRVLYGQTLKTVEKEKRKNCILYMDQNGSWTYIPYTLEANKITLHLGDAHG